MRPQTDAHAEPIWEALRTNTTITVGCVEQLRQKLVTHLCLLCIGRISTSPTIS